MSETSIAKFFDNVVDPARPEFPQIAPLRTALEQHAAPLEPLAAQIAQPVLDMRAHHLDDPDNDFEPFILWGVIADAIKQMPSQIDRIVDLVIALSRVPDPSGYMAGNSSMNHYWRESACTFTLPAPEASDAEKKKHRLNRINMHTFNAKLSTYRIKRLDQRFRAGFVFRRALEEKPWEVYYDEWIEESMDNNADDREDPEIIAWRDAQLARRDIRMLNYCVPSAAVWIEHDAKGIYAMDEPLRNSPDEPSAWEGPEIWCKERFHLWKDRFIWVSRVTALEHDTRQRAAKAAEIMQRIIDEDNA